MDLKEEKKEKVLAFINSEGYVPLKKEEIAHVIGVPKAERNALFAVLDELRESGSVICTKKGKYMSVNKMNIYKGRYRKNVRGFGFVDCPDMDRDIYVSAENSFGAMNNDKVLVKIINRANGGQSDEGSIAAVLERAKQNVVGTFVKKKNHGIVIPDDKKIDGDIYIPETNHMKAHSGDKVVAQITKWPDAYNTAGKFNKAHKSGIEGNIIEILGNREEPGVDVMSVIRSYEIPVEFEEATINLAQKISNKIPPDVAEKRVDFRKIPMVTIDGKDAKDLDDAVSLDALENGNYKLGVHIADVSFYVRENTSLDNEAFERGTSVYFTDRVVPMLPKELSNGICSLNQGEDRLSLSVIMEIDKRGEIVSHEICESVINVDERMTYDDVFAILEKNPSAEDKPHWECLCKRYEKFVPAFKDMKELALTLREKRRKRGAIDFDFPEAQVLLDDRGIPVDIIKRKITIANQIIEEFMLACNETVAERFEWLDIPFVYRIHEEPDPIKIDNFSRFAKNAGFSMKKTEKPHPKMFQELADKIKDTPKERIISVMMLRSMRKAKYSSEDIGHFGLAARFYCHFTSPIRRYPDLIIHRIIKEHLHGKLNEKKLEYYNENIGNIAYQCSERELRAEEAEREVEDLKKAEYMKKRIGEDFEGIVSNITSFGIFVELENTVEGLIRLDYLADDYYIYDDKNMDLTGERTGKRYCIGQKLKIRVASVDIPLRQINFYPVELII